MMTMRKLTFTDAWIAREGDAHSFVLTASTVDRDRRGLSRSHGAMTFSFGRKGFAVRLNNGNHEWRFIARRNAWPVGQRGLMETMGTFLGPPFVEKRPTAQGKYGSREKELPQCGR